MASGNWFRRGLAYVVEQYPLAAFWVYVGLFVLALPFVFIFPPGVLVLFLGSLFSLPFTVLGYHVLRACRDRMPVPAAEAPGLEPPADDRPFDAG